MGKKQSDKIHDSTENVEIEKTILSDPAGSKARRSRESSLVPDDTASESFQPFGGPDGVLSGHFGRYRVIKTLGEGAMGAVYLAQDNQLDRRVALKVPKLGSGDNEQFIERFYREARSAANLSHPNICSVYDVGQIDGRHYIAMEYVEGYQLSQYIETKKTLPQRSCALVVKKVAMGLVEAHAHGIVHRDIKPANVMINQRNEPVLMDFGLAQRLSHEQDGRLTQEGALLGSPAYMSPEQVSGRPDQVGPVSDVYSLGVLMFEMLTGELPFKGVGTIASIIAEILMNEAPDIMELRGDMDPKLGAICKKAMAKKVEERYPSMEAFADELKNYLSGTNAGSSKLLGQSGIGKLAKLDLEAARLQEQTRMVHAFCKEGQYEAAESILQKMIKNARNQESKYVRWAHSELPRVRTFIEENQSPDSFDDSDLIDDLEVIDDLEEIGEFDPLSDPLQSDDPFAVDTLNVLASSTSGIGIAATDSAVNASNANVAPVKKEKKPFQPGDIPTWIWLLIPFPVIAVICAIIGILIVSMSGGDSPQKSNPAPSTGEENTAPADQPAEDQSSEDQPSEDQPSEDQALDDQSPDDQSADDQLSENQSSEDQLSKPVEDQTGSSAK